MKTADRDWNDADCARLSEMWAALVRVSDIAAALSRTPSSIRQKRFIMRLPARNPVRPSVVSNRFAWSTEDVLRLRAMWSDVDAGEIGKELGRTRNGVIGKANRLGLPAITNNERWRRWTCATGEVSRRRHPRFRRIGSNP